MGGFAVRISRRYVTVDCKCTGVLVQTPAICMSAPVGGQIYRDVGSQNRDYNRSPTSVGTFDVNGAAHVASRMLAAILLASKNGEFDRV